MFAIEMYNITKTFGEGLIANNNITLKVKKGEIHALVGENGAGKSTLMNILYGMYKPDAGKIIVNGREEKILSPTEGIKLGIGMVHQHFMLVAPLTVLENVILGDETVNKLGLIDYKSCEKKINSLTNSFNINIDLKAKVENIAVGIQQKIEILKILYRNAEILILDEPTAVLTPQETDELFKTLSRLKSEGKTIILITHKLGEVLSVSDSVTVLRDGRVSGEFKTCETSTSELASRIVGGELEQISSKNHQPSEKTILSVNDLTVMNDKGIAAVKNVSFDIHAGEIFGVAGVEGNGQSELVEAVNGLRKFPGGEIYINGKMLKWNYPIAHIPADRHKYGIVKEYSISENIILGRERERTFSSLLSMNKRTIISFTNQMIKQFDIRPKDPEAITGGLSGGNQQKTVAARELTKQTDLITASHPTRGLDIKATCFVHTTLLKESEKGKAILLVSSELSELLKLSDKIAVMYNGEINALLETSKTNEHEIGFYMTGAQQNV